VRYCPACHSVYPNDFRTCPKDQSGLRAASELQPGMVLRGKYEVLERVGAGGMATVYRARHLAFDEVCAIKVVATKLADDDDFLRRFRNEAIVARRFQHQNAVRVDDLDTTEDGRPFIVMEYVEGANLREVVRREGALSLRRAVTLARQVASALAAAHDLGIVHRDIKPDNILLAGSGPEEKAKVLDFGIAKVKEGFFAGGDHVATRTGAVVGTPQYISPEQAMGRRGDELDGRADLYSLGVVLYEMVTGRLPFESDTAMGIILHHLQTPPTPPHEMRPDLGIPEPLSAVLLKALDKDRERRFRTAGDMIAALDGVLALALPERPEGVATPKPVPTDIDRHETRVMPKTPTAAGSTHIAPATVHLPPLPGAPVPTPPRTGTPPPLPVFTDPGKVKKTRGRWRWWKWGLAGLAFYALCGRPSTRKVVLKQEDPAAAVAASPAADQEARERDEELKEKVEGLLDDSPVDDEAIYVNVHDGVVTLTGHVHDRKPAQEADRIVRAAPGVVDLVNEIELRAPNDHRATVPRAEAVPAVPAPEAPELPEPPAPAFPAIPPGFEQQLEKMAKRIPVTQLVKVGQQQLESGNPQAAMESFSAALSIDPTNREAADGARAAGRVLAQQAAARDRAARQRERDLERARRGAPSPPPGEDEP
jgi:serine/threonine protein kinase